MNIAVRIPAHYEEQPVSMVMDALHARLSSAERYVLRGSNLKTSRGHAGKQKDLIHEV